MKKLILTFLSVFCALFASPCQANPEARKSIIVFDFGGVIADVDKTTLTNFIQRSLHLSLVDVEKVLQSLRESRAKGIPEEEFWKEYAASTQTTLPQNWMEDLDIAKQSAVIPNPHMLELVKMLKARGYRVAMLSNVQKHQAKIVREKGLYLYFDPLLLSCEIGVEKPNMDAFAILVQRLKARPQECILIDDTLDNITAAQRFGITGILFQSVDSLLAELKRRNIPDTSEERQPGFHFSIR